MSTVLYTHVHVCVHARIHTYPCVHTFVDIRVCVAWYRVLWRCQHRAGTARTAHNPRMPRKAHSRPRRQSKAQNSRKQISRIVSKIAWMEKSISQQATKSWVSDAVRCNELWNLKLMPVCAPRPTSSVCPPRQPSNYVFYHNVFSLQCNPSSSTAKQAELSPPRWSKSLFAKHEQSATTRRR